MPVSYTTSDRGRFVEFVISGKVTDAEIIERKRAMAGDGAIAPGYSELCDATGVTSAELGPDFLDGITAAAKLNQEAHRNGRTAIVVSRADLFDLSRQYERIVAGLGITVIVFNHRDTALLWLGRWQPGQEWWRNAGRAEEAAQNEGGGTSDKPQTWGRGKKDGQNGDGAAGGAGEGSGIVPPRRS